jgi:hypothetical protein
MQPSSTEAWNLVGARWSAHVAGRLTRRRSRFSCWREPHHPSGNRVSIPLTGAEPFAAVGITMHPGGSRRSGAGNRRVAALVAPDSSL